MMSPTESWFGSFFVGVSKHMLKKNNSKIIIKYKMYDTYLDILLTT